MTNVVDSVIRSEERSTKNLEETIMKRLKLVVVVLASLMCLASVMAQERQVLAASSGSRIYTNPYTGVIYFDYFSTKDHAKSTEACQDKLVCSTNGCAVYFTGSTSISAVLFTGAGLSGTNFDENTEVGFGFYDWYYTGKLGDDPKYKVGGTKAVLPITYVDASGITNNIGTLTIGFGKQSITISVAAKAPLIIAGGYVSNANDGDSISPSFYRSTGGSVTIGGYYVAGFNVTLKGTVSFKAVKGKDRNTYKLYTAKDTGAGTGGKFWQ